MEINVSQQDEWTILKPEGRVDTQTATSFQEKCTSVIESGATKVIFDFETVNFLSSMGLRVILTTAKTLKTKGGSLSLCRPNSDVSQVLNMSGFQNFLPIHDTLEEATSN